MPVDQGVKPGAAGFVLAAGVNGPAGDVGIGGNASIFCSSAAGGRGQTGNVKAGGVVEHAQSSRAKARPARGDLRDCTACLRFELVDVGLLVEQPGGQGIAPRLGGLQVAHGLFGSQALFGGVGCGLLGQLHLQRRAAQRPGSARHAHENQGQADKQQNARLPDHPGGKAAHTMGPHAA